MKNLELKFDDDAYFVPRTGEPGPNIAREAGLTFALAVIQFIKVSASTTFSTEIS